MQKHLSTILVTVFLASCVAIPVKDEHHVSKCELSTDKKTLKIVDVAKETNSYYSVWDYVLSPILVPTTAIISGTYVLVNNTYHLGEEKIKCGNVLSIQVT